MTFFEGVKDFFLFLFAQTKWEKKQIELCEREREVIRNTMMYFYTVTPIYRSKDEEDRS